MLRRAAAILFVLGLGGGTLSDVAGALSDEAEGPPQVRGGYRVLAADFHVHSFLGDDVLLPWDVLLQARRQGLQALAITNHNHVVAAKICRWVSRVLGGPIVLVGDEISTLDYHIAAVGIDEPVSTTGSATQAIEQIHRQGGVAIAAHPTARFWPGFGGEAMRKLDGAEVVHPIIYFRKGALGELQGFYQRGQRMRRSFTAIGSSDYHFFGEPGLCRTYVFASESSESGVLEALRNGRTVVYDPDGRTYGDPALVRLVRDQPLDRRAECTSRPRGALRGVIALFGWVGLTGLLVLGLPGLP